VNAQTTVTDILDELLVVLADEHAALLRLDHAAIGEQATRKSSLEAALTAAIGPSSLPSELGSRLRAVRRAALTNQLLLVHARACLQGLLGLRGAAQAPVYPGSGARQTAPAPLRVDVRG